ncbi:MAG TPA: 2'-5' RNA ligase family protein [Dongiaceae bacterium]|nr:2'-5' RNA ligase family protein [Dongiaceae bacterium]
MSRLQPNPASRIAMPPFRIALDHAKSLGNGRNRPLVLCGGDGVAGLIRFREMLGSAMQEAGLGRWSRTDWLPHLTLLYDQRAIGEEAIDPISWAVRVFVLVHSLVSAATCASSAGRAASGHGA